MVYYLGYKPPFDRMSANENLDGDFLQVTLRDEAEEPLLRIAKGITALQAGCPVGSDFLPKVLQITSGRGALTDFDGYRGMLYISPRMKAIIEQFEPDMHQFFPLRLVDRKKEFLADHWIWVVCNRIDSVDREHTTYKFVNDATWMSNYLDGDTRVRIEGAILYFSNRQSAGYHFWRDKHLMAFSDLIRPTGLRYLLGPRLPQNQSGFQAAHVVVPVRAS